MHRLRNTAAGRELLQLMDERETPVSMFATECRTRIKRMRHRWATGEELQLRYCGVPEITLGIDAA